MPGKLTVVATPIGNLDDLSTRAVAVLRDADLVACEDTRHSGRLLTHLGLKKRLVSLHEHNERQRLPRLLGALDQGLSVVLISDAGTPLLSDPGYVLVRTAIEHHIEVDHIPGPAAPIAALVLSGLPPYPFTFAGFPPPKAGRRRRFFARFANLDHTLVVFESPHRLLASLDDLREVLGDRPVAIGRELTKQHQEILRGALSDIRDELGQRPTLKGEFTVVVGTSPGDR